MFSKEIINTDRFQSMKLSAQALYFHLGINADDDGFIGNPLSIIRSIGASANDLKALVENKYLIPFNGYVYLIADWHINNYIRADRYKPTIYQEYIQMIQFNDSQRYVIRQSVGIPMVDPDKSSIDKISTDKKSIEELTPKRPTTESFCHPSLPEIKEYCMENSYLIDPESFIDYYEANGWMVGKNPMRDWKAAVRTWARNEKHPTANAVPDFSSWADELSNGGASS